MKIKIILILAMFLLVPIIVNASLSDNVVRSFDLDGDCVDGTETEDCELVSDYVSVDEAMEGTAYNVTEGQIDLKYYNQNADKAISFWINYQIPQASMNGYLFGSTSDPTTFRIQQYQGTLYANIANAGSDYANNPQPYEWHHFLIVHNHTQSSYEIYYDGVEILSAAESGSDTALDWYLATQNVDGSPFQPIQGAIFDEVVIWDRTLNSDEVAELYNGGTGLFYPFSADETPPHITKYSDQGASCSNWNTDTSIACPTGDTTPTLYFNTSKNAYCAIGINDWNYTTMGSSRNCTSGEGTTEHACTLTLQDELVYEDSIVYLSCKDNSGNENTTSTSGALSLTITGLESGSESAIETGIQNALLTDYTIYSDQQIYARKLDGTQDTGTFDRVAKKGSKVWAFNHITKGEEHVGLFNLTPVLYVLEMANSTNSTIINLVELMINETK